MAYTQHNSPFSRKGKAKREAKRQLKSLYKQDYYKPTRVTDADGSVSYKAGGPNEGPQKLNRQARRDIRREARGEDMGEAIQNTDQKGLRTTEVIREGFNRMSSSPLNQNDPQTDEDYEWDVQTGDIVRRPNYTYETTPFGDETRETLDDGRIRVTQSQNVTGTAQEQDDDWWSGLTEEQRQIYRDEQNAKNTRTRYINPRENLDPIDLPSTDIVEVGGDDFPEINIKDIPQVIGGPTGVEEQIQIGKSGRNKVEKVPVVKNKEVRKPGMQKVCTNWEWVERGSGAGQKRSDAGPRPTITKSKTVMRRP